MTNVYRTNPHLDARERALDCATLIVRTVRGEIQPGAGPRDAPAGDQHRQAVHRRGADAGPDGRLRPRGRPARGCSPPASPRATPTPTSRRWGWPSWPSTTAIPRPAARAARWLAGRAWQRRASRWSATPPAPEDALRYAAGAPRGPVVLMDVGDNVGGGSPADSTILLEAAQRLGVRALSSDPLRPRRPSPPASPPAWGRSWRPPWGARRTTCTGTPSRCRGGCA